MQWKVVFATVLAVYHRGTSGSIGLSGRSAKARAQAPPASRAAESSAARPVRAAGILQLWQEALATFSAQAGPILVCCLFGFALLAILGALYWVIADPLMSHSTTVATAGRLDDYLHLSSTFATYEGLSRLFAVGYGNLHSLLLVQAIAGAFVFAFARGAITHIALSRDKAVMSLRTSCRATVKCFPALLLGTLLYGGAVAAGTVGLNVLLRERGLDLSNTGQKATSFEAAMPVVALRSMNAFIPQAAPPFAEFAPYWRFAASTDLLKAQSYARRLKDSGGNPLWSHFVLIERDPAEFALYSADEPQFWLLAIGGIVLIVAAEPLLRFCAVMSVKPARSPRPRRFSPLSTLMDGVRFGLNHFGTITVHLWLLRLALCALSAVFVILPIVLSENFLPSIIIRVTGAGDMTQFRLLTTLLTWMSMALVNAIFNAFGTVYDARLAARLDPSLTDRSPCTPENAP